MPRLPRGDCGGEVYHVLNRANARSRIFFTSKDYLAFLRLVREAQERTYVPMLAYCVMPNHWHFLMHSINDGDLSKFIQWLSVTHTHRVHKVRGTVGEGHIYQGRFKTFPVESSSHLLVVARYVERNALRANLVKRAEHWAWGSLFQSQRMGSEDSRPILTALPVDRPEPWIDFVNQDETQRDLALLRLSTARGRPYGSEGWVKNISLRMRHKL